MTTGAAPFVHLTVAGPGGARVGKITLENLLGALETVRDRTLAVQVANDVRTAIAIEGELLAGPEHDVEEVLWRVQDALAAAYTVERRSFGQPATAAEVLAIVHGVVGVVGARLTGLYRVPDREGGAGAETGVDGDAAIGDGAVGEADGDGAVGEGGVAEVIEARDARVEFGRVIPAELIISAAEHICFREMVS
jgi:hypothetical protein